MLSVVTGYLASVLLAISLLVNNDLKFRWINTLGCLSFIIYGILINAFPIILTNSILLVINVVYLIKIYNRTEDFDLLEFNESGSLVHKFISFYNLDITAYFKNFKEEDLESNLKFVVLRDVVIANIFIASLNEKGEAIVKLNYTVPKYRDNKVGRFIFEKDKKFLLEKGVKELIYLHVTNKDHEQFIKRMGFKKELITGVYKKQL
ncbi:hypothetical protein BH09BAC2_BH09BAC2_18990 [soil metagenome]